MEKYLKDYLVYLEANHFAIKTLEFVELVMGSFFKWLKENGVKNLVDITFDHMFSYQEHLKERINFYGNKESVQSQRKKLQVIRDFLEYLKDQGFILTNPGQTMKLPKSRRSIPRDILTKEEVQLILSKPDISTKLGLRDRAILELLYATGMRRMEIASLRLNHIDFKEQTIEIRNSKCAKDRIIPVSEKALFWLDRYLRESRPRMCSEKTGDFVFLVHRKRPFTVSDISLKLKRYFVQSDLGHMGVCHVFRHTFATHMLEAGVDLRLIQEMLGHSDVEVTTIYTRVSIRKLQEVHARTHPAKPQGMSKRYWEEVANLKTSSLAEEEPDPAPVQSATYH